MRRHLITFVAATTIVAGSFGSSAGAALPTLIFAGNGLTVAHLGTSETATMTTLTRLLGHPTSKLGATPGLKNCGVAASAAWYSLGVYFNHNRLVGLSQGPGHVPASKTVAGLQLGNSLSQARKIYGAKLTTAKSHGGAWFAFTSTGRISGFLNPSTGSAPKPTATILTIDVGAVGCPAMSP